MKGNKHMQKLKRLISIAIATAIIMPLIPVKSYAIDVNADSLNTNSSVVQNRNTYIWNGNWANSFEKMFK
ncbi:MAG: hypothetical protein RR322_05460 [Oscillospiraceae bacterium]